MQVVFRVDASLEAGAGHVMRCLTLANALRAENVICRFICRVLPGNLIAMINQRGYEVLSLPPIATKPMHPAEKGPYAGWLGVSWREDANQSLAAMATFEMPEWVVVDNYALDEQWERAVRAGCRRVFVIDDLANRRHDADILLDQTYGRERTDYLGLVDPECKLRCGVEYVLLRPEFDEWRSRSRCRRVTPKLMRILVSLGGVDFTNLSRRILLALDQCDLPSDVQICVVLGESSPWIADIQQLAKQARINIEIQVAVSNMAELLSGCDLAIGAAGSSAWERCCLGVPTLMLVLADNQSEIATKLSNEGVAMILPTGADLEARVISSVQLFLADPVSLKYMSDKAAAMVPSSGVKRLVQDTMGIQ